MLSVALALLLQVPTEHAILKAEYSRSEDTSVLMAGLRSSDPRLQRLAVRAIGRLERKALADAIRPLVSAPSEVLRREAVAALAQMGAPTDFLTRVSVETSGLVRATLYEAIGRAQPLAEGSESSLVRGLRDEDGVARTGASRGLETLIRLNRKTTRPAAETIEALREAFRVNTASRLRQFVLLALNAAGGGDGPTYDLALRDDDPLVRRLAVVGSKRFVEDSSPLVRLEALRVAGTCERARRAVDDVSGHVALVAVDFLGTSKCDAALIEPIVDGGRSWRLRTRALVSLAKVAPELARARLKAFASDPLWQVRVYTAQAAKLVTDVPTLAQLSSDANPNVAAAALTTGEQALRALASDHSGLLLEAAARLKGTPDLKEAAPRILATIKRLTQLGRVTVRDPRLRLIELLVEAGDLMAIEALRPLLADRDPEVAALVAKSLTSPSGKAVRPVTGRYVPEPFPSEATLRSLTGARAVIVMKGLGTFTVELLPEEAPATVATFARLAEGGAYKGLTFHRVVPNFVLQGGSPGADEYDALTREFMRDELGFTSNERGTLGVSTRGHDTGDGQIFINLVDNWRLDHVYTVFARVIAGQDVVDRILEGDVIEAVTILRSRASRS